MVVVDEAHRLKNSKAKLYTTLMEEVAFANCLLLTGTPIQVSAYASYFNILLVGLTPVLSSSSVFQPTTVLSIQSRLLSAALPSDFILCFL
jgi:hypothetical protein